MAQSATIWPAAVSERSAALVASPQRPARVLAAFRSALYLVLDDGAVLPLVSPAGLRLPTAVCVATAAPTIDWGVQPGGIVSVGDGQICIPGAVVRVVRSWRPLQMPRAKGALTWWPATLGDVGRSVSPLRDSARSLVERIGAGYDPGPTVRALVGAGPGLTPSGDDALCGVMLALRLAGRDGSPTADLLWRAVRSRLTSTTSLSASLLAEAAAGYAVPPAVRLGSAILGGRADEASRHARELLAVGHSSGADLLDGLLGCLDAIRSPSAASPAAASRAAASPAGASPAAADFAPHPPHHRLHHPEPASMRSSR